MPPLPDRVAGMGSGIGGIETTELAIASPVDAIADASPVGLRFGDAVEAPLLLLLKDDFLKRPRLRPLAVEEMETASESL